MNSDIPRRLQSFASRVDTPLQHTILDLDLGMRLLNKQDTTQMSRTLKFLKRIYWKSCNDWLTILIKNQLL
ncbi:hypothetical protein C436_21600 [Haloarcula marismortui ATCC 33800]|uniref:Uncharacterized protein n=1 Tax=Haloarcula marismortui ATCC 33800 TaxID=662476 RepID=M0JFU3_9EURY|nr:hypothetical protein C436_21600 [Haloarcula sinaiiensis ATCC 33800]